MDRVKDYDIKQSMTFARRVPHEAHRSHAGQIAREAGPGGRRMLELGCGNQGIASGLSPSDVLLAGALA